MDFARAVRSSVAAAALLGAALAGASPASANGVGDLYVAVASGVLEIHVDSQAVVTTMHVTPGPRALAFSPDGRWLFIGSDSAHVVPLEIATLELRDRIALPDTATALAFPSGQILVGSMPARRTLAFIDVPSGAVRESEKLEGPGNLLAADRRDPRVAVAEAGASWIDVIDPATSTVERATVPGEIRAIAIDRDHGGVLVATHAPDAVLRLDMLTLTSTWSASLPGVPVAVAALDGPAVVAGETELWKATSAGSVKFAKPKGEVLGLAASDDAKVIHASESDRIEAFDSAGTLRRTVQLAGSRVPAAMAAVTSGSSIFLGNGQSGLKSPSPASSAKAAPGPFATGNPPTTSEIAEAVQAFLGEPPVQGAVAVALAILLCCWLFDRWLSRRFRRG